MINKTNSSNHSIVKSTNGRVIRITRQQIDGSSNKMAVSQSSPSCLVNVKAIPESKIIPKSMPSLNVIPMKRRAPKTVTRRQSSSFSSRPPELTVSNVISTFATRCGIDLRYLARNGRHVELKPGSSICYKKLRDPFCTANISSTGKITIVGAASVENAYIASRRVARSLFKMGFNVRFSRYRVVNVFASASLSFGVDLFSFHNRHVVDDDSVFEKKEFESEQHPGAHYSFKGSFVSFTIFRTGSLSVTGQSLESIEEDLERLYPYLMEFATDRPKERTKYTGNNKKLRFISKYLNFSSEEDDSFDSQTTTTEDD